MNTNSVNARSNLGLEHAPHLRAPITTRRIMLITFLALLPAMLVSMYFFGCGLIWQFILVALTGYVCEGACALLRRRSVGRVLRDNSVLVTAGILALTLPPLMPWYYTLCAALFAFLIVKQAFGGLGMNIFNPAMAAFIFLVIAAPAPLGSAWLTPTSEAYVSASPGTTFDVIFGGKSAQSVKNRLQAQKQLKEAVSADGTSGATAVDALSGATFLEKTKIARKAGNPLPLMPELSDDGLSQAVLVGAIVLGGFIMMVTHMVLIKMVVTFIISLWAFSFLGHMFLPDLVMEPLTQFFYGGTALAAFFIITDPVTNAGTARGRVVFAVFVAFLIVLIRAFGSYADSVAFAVMLGNAAAPLIDVLTHRRAFGVGFKKEDF